MKSVGMRHKIIKGASWVDPKTDLYVVNNDSCILWLKHKDMSFRVARNYKNRAKLLQRLAFLSVQMQDLFKDIKAVI